MSARHTAAKKRIAELEALLLKAADHIDSAADVIEDLNGDDDEECDTERGFADMIRRTVRS